MRMPRYRGGTAPVELDQQPQAYERLVGDKPAQLRQLPVRDRRPLMMFPMMPGEMRGEKGGFPGLQVEAMGEVGALVLKPQAQPEEHHEGRDERSVPQRRHPPQPGP